MQKSSGINRRWRYVRVGKFLVCVDQSALSLARFLWLGYDENKLDSIGLPRGFWRSALKHLLKVRVRRSNPADHIELPAFGHMGLVVHGGYKLFDLSSQVVTKVFASAVDALTAEKEIAASRQASVVPAAPRFVGSDPDMNWYCEEYIRGVHATAAVYRRGVTISDLYGEVEVCLLDLVKSAPPVRIDTDQHIDALADDGFVARWNDADGDPDMIKECVEYLNALRECLANSDVKPSELQLVLTHGDFSLVNAIVSGDSLRFIDWEGIRPGGLYSDIYHFLFVEKYYDRATQNFSEDVANFIAAYRKASLEELPELKNAVNIDLTFARRLYYLERVRLMLDRDVSANISKVIRKSIAMYREFDREHGDDEL